MPRLVLLIGFTYVFLANSWLGDDAFITFRVAENFVSGYGLTFNPPERVQAYTHPLWLFLNAAGYVITHNFVVTAYVLSLALCLATIALAFRFVRTSRRAALFVALLVSSKAFVDYTSSGLEYPLSDCLLALFFVRWLSDEETEVDVRALRVYGLIAALGFLTRNDTILLYAPALLWLAIKAWPRLGWRRIAGAYAMASTPAVAWLLFSLVYYGFPFPNTYYAKVATGIPAWLSYRQGLSYVLNSINFDPLTLATVALAVGISLWRREMRYLTAAAGALLYVAYTISIGGDFMSGRFFVLPFLLAAFIVVSLVRTREACLGGVALLAAYNACMPLVPIKTTTSYQQAWPWRLQNGIKDERGFYHEGTNLLRYDPLKPIPDHVWIREGLSFSQVPQRAVVLGSIGYFGLEAGPKKYLIDRNALSDPLLARLPVSDRLAYEFYVGHYFRDLPDGYVESCEQDKNLLTDPLLHNVYDALRTITRGPIFSRERLRDIWLFNAGRFRDLHRQVLARRHVSLAISALNERFQTDVGYREPQSHVLRSSGERAGYLQYGPGTAMRAGRYRIRWVGSYDAPAPADAGFVEVWDGEHRVARERVVAAEHTPDGPEQDIGDIEFTLNQPVDRLDYRLLVNQGVKLAIERIEIEGEPLAGER